MVGDKSMNNQKVKTMMACVADITEMVTVKKEEFAKKHPFVSVPDMQTWISTDPFKKVSAKALAAVKGEKDKCGQVIRKSLQDRETALLSLAGGQRGGGSWKERLSSNCAFSEAVKIWECVLRDSFGSDLMAAFSDLSKDQHRGRDLSLSQCLSLFL